MSCEEARIHLRPADVLRVSDAEVEMALEHAENCSACGAILDEDRRVARLIREAVPRARARPELRDRVYKVFAASRDQSP